MNIKKNFGVMFSLVLVSGCAGTIMNPVAVPEEDCPPIVKSAGPINSDSGAYNFVDYTDVANGYRQYGERTPRDQNVVSTGAGSNMSASIPPSVDEEVEEYEDVVSQEENVEDGYSAQNQEDPVEDWLAEEGQNLKGLLGEWSERAGWRLVWKSNRNYPLTAGAMFRGRFADASAALIRTFARARPAPIATFYKGNRVLVVETREDENAFE